MFISDCLKCQCVFPVRPQPTDPCSPSPCGENAQCSSQDGVARCTCIPPYIGNPYAGGCRPECVISADCPAHLACLVSHCRDPCPGVCGINAQCSVVNHLAVCSCLPGFTGDPFSSCRQEVVAGKYRVICIVCIVMFKDMYSFILVL